MTNQNLKLNEGKLSVLKVKDKTDKLTISVNRLFDLPFRLVLTGKSGSGKGGIITNMYLMIFISLLLNPTQMRKCVL